MRARSGTSSAPQTEELKPPATGKTDVYFAGTDTKIIFGDGLLFSGTGPTEFRRVLTVKPDFELKKTRVTWSGGLANDAKAVQVMRDRANLFGHNAPGASYKYQSACDRRMDVQRHQPSFSRWSP